VWAGVLLMCGQFERVSGLDRFRLADTDMPFDP
jgi:hypothetical protein